MVQCVSTLSIVTTHHEGTRQHQMLRTTPNIHGHECRQMREGERDGIDYHFVSKATFQQWIAADELFEHALVYGQYKGIPKKQVLDALANGSDVVLRLDVQVCPLALALMIFFCF
jgi:guanylate kinase